MPSIADLLHYLKDPSLLIVAVGMFGIPAIIFVETGLLFPMLPGDSLLVTAGLLASQPNGPVPLNVWTLGITCSLAAIAGNTTGFFIGRSAGKALFTREDSRFFKKSYIQQAHAFYETHGGKTIFIAQFMPIVRTFAPVVAGAAEMRFLTFVTYNITGALTWIWSMLLIGYFIATQFPIVGKHVEKLIIVIVLLSIMPAIIGWLRGRGKKS
ncbi:MAG: DedA family protein [Betaproteobacteria bacterium]|jgi:membrane-associated protein|nr:DedA family protein [Betaproteobacteria bacterium]